MGSEKTRKLGVSVYTALTYCGSYRSDLLEPSEGLVKEGQEAGDTAEHHQDIYVYLCGRERHQPEGVETRVA